VGTPGYEGILGGFGEGLSGVSPTITGSIGGELVDGVP